MKLSATLITLDEEAKLGRALESLRSVADEIVVLDSGSSDGTLEIARTHTNRVYIETWRGYRDQKQRVTELASHDWVLSLDADECLSPELQQEISALKTAGPGRAGYRIPRLSRFMGRWIRHTTWYPDYQLRLFDRRRGRWSGGRVHEAVRLQGTAGTLHSPLHHYSYADIGEYLRQLDNFSSLAAADLLDRGRRATALQLVASPAATLFKNLVLRLGFLDGVPGVAVSVMSATSTFFKLLKLRELQRNSAGSGSESP